MIEQEIDFTASDMVHTVHALLWTPDDTDVAPVAVVQLVHGMSEHIERYRDFASYLTEQGFVVCAHDHLGHGKTVRDTSELGHISLANGKQAMLDNVHALRQKVMACYAGVPYVIMGHSMGSFITRLYMAKHGQGVDACVICGTGNPLWIASAPGHVLVHIMTCLSDETRVSKFVNMLGMGGFATAIPHARTKLDWLCTDDAVVDAYIADPLCAQTFTLGGWHMLSSLTQEVVTHRHARCVPIDVPMLFVSGEEDPVGQGGVQVKKAAALYANAGVKDIKVKLYPGMRHEILNEPEHQRVYADISEWIISKLHQS